MASYCIPKQNIEKVKRVFAKLGDNGLGSFMKKTNAEKVRLFKQVLPEDEAKLFVDGLEKSFADKRLRTFGNYLKKNLDGDTKIDEEINFLGKNFKNIKDVDNFIHGKAREIAEKQEGLKLTDNEVKEIMAIGKRSEEANKKLITVTKEKDGRLTNDYAEALSQQAKTIRESEKFLMKSAGVSWAETFNSHLKALMLAKPSTIAVNILSNKENSLFQKSVKRIGSRKWNGYNSDLAQDMAKAMYKVSQDTSETIFGKRIGVGYDLSRSLSVDDMTKKNIIGEKMEAGRDTFFTRLVFETGLGRADYNSARIAFVDTLNLESSKMADIAGLTGEKAKNQAKDWMMDAFELIPKTEEGKALRASAVADALRATWTDNRILSKYLLKAREGINKMTFSDKIKIRIGDLLEPFVKTTSNIIQFGTDISGLGIPKSVYKFIKYKKNKSILTQGESEKLFASSIRDLVGSVGGIGGALIMASMIDDDDFIGAYDPSRLKYDELKNGNSNSIRIFGHWVSTDYNILATPLIGVLYAKKYGKDNMADMVYQYSKGVANQTLKAPVISTFAEMSTDFSRKFGENSDKQDAYKYLADTLVGQLSSRIPGFFQDITQLIDDKKRDTTKYRDKFLSKIPILSKKSPEKMDILGDVIETELGGANTEAEKIIAGFFQIMAGARVKKEKNEPFRNEVFRLKDAGVAPTITDWKYRLPPKLVKLKEKVGEDEFRRIFKEDYGTKLRTAMLNEINSAYYKNIKDEDKKKRLDKIEDGIINGIYTRNNIK